MINLPLVVFAGRADKRAWIDVESVSDFSKNGDAGRYPSPLDRSNVTRTETGHARYIFLRQVTLMAKPTQVGSQGMLEVHAPAFREPERKF